MRKKKIDYNPYCELCGNCGEEGCCSHIGCFSTLVKNPKCEYGFLYVKQAILNDNTNKMVFELIRKLEKDESYTKEQFISDFNSKYDEFMDQYFDKVNKQN